MTNNLDANSDLTDRPGLVEIELGKKLKSLRQQANKTQADIAQHLDISAQQYQKYEKGTSKCNIANLYKLAAYYNKTVNDLLPPLDQPLNEGMSDNQAPLVTNDKMQLTDEADAMSQLLSVFIRVPSKESRRKLLKLLSEMFDQD